MVVRVWAQYGGWPPVGEVVLDVGSKAVTLDPENADIVGSALLAFAESARAMTRELEACPRAVEGVWVSGGGGRC